MKRFLKDFSDLKKGNCLRIEYISESHKLQIMYREDFRIENTNLPSIINNEDAEYFRVLEYIDQTKEDEDQHDDNAYSYFDINNLRFVFSRFSKENAQCSFRINQEGNGKVIFTFDGEKDVYIEFDLACVNSGDVI